MAGSASCRAIPRAVRRGDRPAPVGSHFLHRPQPPALRPGDRLALLPTVDLELLSKIGHSWAILAERRIGAITTFTIRLPTQASWNAVHRPVMIAAARSAMARTVALVLAETIDGMTDASANR